MKFTRGRTHARYILQHFHNHDFLSAEPTSSSGRVKVQEGLDAWQV